MTYKYLIVGGGVAGVTAAETIREHDAEGSIGLINDEPYTLYSRVMLSKPGFFLEKIPFDKIWMKNQKWYEEHHVTFIGGRRATALNTAAKTVMLVSGEVVGYQELLLATGSCTRKWGVKGAEKSGVHYLRTLDDGKSIIAAIKTAKSAVTIGSGFISFEMADMLRAAGLRVTSIFLENYFWEPVLDEASGKMVEAALEKAGVVLMRKSEVAEVAGNEAVEKVILKSGEEIPCDLIVCGIGTYCQVDWLKDAGLGVARGLLANEFLETSVPDVFTAGDSAEFEDMVLQETVQMGNWVNAHEQGMVAAKNMLAAAGVAGVQKEPFKFVSFYTTGGLGVSVAFVGDVRPLPGRTVVKRGSPEANSYARLMLSGARIEGATLLNRTAELTTIANLIKTGMDVSAHLAELSDPEFDLKKLVSSP